MYPLLMLFGLIVACLLLLFSDAQPSTPATQRRPRLLAKIGYRLKMFLYAYIQSLLILFGRVRRQYRVYSQVTPFDVRHALLTMLFGRGLLRS